ncbi:hypothetical protein D3C81_1110320 [compost metagenome]
MHTTGEVQTQLHRAGAQAAQPVGRGRRQVQRHHVVVAEGAAHHVLGRQLVFLTGQAQQRALLAEARPLDRDAGILERLTDAIDIGLLDLQRSAGTAELDGRIVGIEVGRGIDEADPEYHEDQQIFPQGIFVEHDAARSEIRAHCAP